MMFIETQKVKAHYTRISRLGATHSYTRIKTVAVFQCDNCNTLFSRDLGSMDHRRLNNVYFHVCPKCNPKQFAQRRGVERRTMWNLTADSDKDISRI
jgi:hypothetical protein